MDSGWRVEQIGWWCGIVSPVLIVAGFFSIDEGGTTPSDGAIGDLVHEIVSSHSRIIAGSLVGMVGSLLLVWFGSSLRSRLSEDNRGVFIGAAGYGFTIVMTTGALGHGAFRLGLTSIEDSELLAEAMRPLAILGSHTLDVFVWGMVGLAIAMAIGSFAIHLLPRTMGLIGALLSIGVIALAPTDHGGVGIALLPWLSVASLFLLRRSRRVLDNL